MLDPGPGADQAVEHVLHWLERRQCCYLLCLGNEFRDYVDVRVEACFECLELLDKAFNPLRVRKLLSFPSLARAAHLVRHAVVALEQGHEGHMGIPRDQGPVPV